MADEQPKKRVTKPKEVSVAPKARAARVRKPAEDVAPVKMPRSAGRSKSPAASAADRQRMIAERAYYLAEARSFAGGDCQADWYAAEAWIDAQLST
ncbi:MAG: hypothetical protein B7Z70_11995 [Acidithiobacillus ferrivorans]|uniref:DUF2934 domain-containing protein n=1 Tax=Acidithiobacillus ferrivorans TaxID=160808 RepID=A0A257SMS6_9PROT|nr:MAG: hypothetical protein B7Z70_11995 [Acidithiobacillus ferrivorans]